VPAMKKPSIVILFFLISFANFLGVLYSAALPNLTDDLHITKVDAQKTISFYVIGCLLAQIAYAPVAKAIGRKKAIYIGCAIAIFGSLLCVISIQLEAFSLLLAGRVLTAFGAACGPILTSTLIADAFSLHEQKKILSYLMSGFTLLSALGVTIGGFITQYFAWQDCFYFMLFYALLVSSMCLLLPETSAERGTHHLRIFAILKSYFKQFSNPLPVLYALIVASASIILYVFSVEAPFIAQNQLHLSPDAFGLYNLIPNLGLLLGGLASAYFSHKLSSKKLILLGAVAFTLFSITMWTFFNLGLINTLTLFGFPFLIFFVTPTIMSHGQACILTGSEDKVYASSAIYMLQYFWVFLSISLLGLFPPQDSSMLPIVYSSAGGLMIVLWIAALLKK
jgi:MFS transporter, DHA1 family, multidrug resistance protein